jgi:zinc/manganese transport system substrate-binding protein
MRSVAMVVVIAGLVAAALAGCSSDDPADGTVSIVTTTTILGDLVRNVVGENAEVEVLMPVGVDPHNFQASARQVAAINRADLVVANGLGLEEGLHDVLEAAAADGTRVWEVGPDIEPRHFSDPPEPASESDDHGHDDGDLDPHFWLDPLRVALAADLLASKLAEAAPDVDWSARASSYLAELEAVNVDTMEHLSTVAPPDRKLVTNHRSFGYFADRYEFEVIGTVIPGAAALANPSSAELAALVAIIEREQVPAIFTETIEPDALARAVAAEVGYDVEVVELYTGSLGAPGSDGDTLVKMLTTNARRIAEALGAP